MKKNIFFLTILFALISFSFVSYSQPEVKFGSRIGLNFATWRGPDAPPNLHERTGLLIGLSMTLQFDEMFSLEPQILFSMKGTRGSRDTLDYTETMNYVEIPVLLKFNIPVPNTSLVKPNIYAGPAFAFNVAATEEAASANYVVSSDVRVRTFDFGLVFGGGINFKLGEIPVDLSIRYTLGLTNWDNSGNNLNIKNGVTSIVAGVAF